jgi:hypothetical protein
MGIMNRGVVYALWDYDAEDDDELDFLEGDCMTVLRCKDKDERVVVGPLRRPRGLHSKKPARGEQERE